MKLLRVLAPLMLFAACAVSAANAQIQPNNFGWQCGPTLPTNCPNVLQLQLPTDLPYTLRLHDTGTWWSQLEISPTTISTTYLDAYLDSLAALKAQGQQHFVVFTFSHVPCWAVNLQTCPNNQPPLDLRANGSPHFHQFVQALAGYCTAKGNCVKDYIQAYEMWNEWNLYTPSQGYVYWSGTVGQLYDMLAPEAKYLKTLTPTPIIVMPSTTPVSTTYQADFQTWLGLENSNGKISDWVNWHLYLTNPGTSGPATVTPEAQWAAYGANFLSIQGSNGWSGVPFVDSETNFSATCD